MTIRYLFLLVILVVGCTQRTTFRDTHALDLSGYQLAHAETFGFGVADGEGPDARPTDREFETLLHKADARKQFIALFEHGSICAKLYSLCAIHYLDISLFHKLAPELSKDHKIWTRWGCCIEEMTVGQVITEIENGQYDDMVKNIIVKLTSGGT